MVRVGVVVVVMLMLMVVPNQLSFCRSCILPPSFPLRLSN